MQYFVPQTTPMLSELDKKYVWHPFTQEKTAAENVGIVSGKGAIITSENDGEYIDAISSWWVNIHGHANEHIANAIAKQAKTLEHVIFAGFTHPKAVEISQRLTAKLGEGFDKVFFSDNGSTANEVAIKMSFQYFYNQGTPKHKIVAFKDSYHGDTYGAMSVGGRSTFSAPFEEHLFDVFHLDIPTEENFEEVKKQMKQFLATGEVAAFVFEPLVLGTAGMICYQPWQLDELIQMVHDAGALCIADEVFTGFYRTGTIFAIDQIKNKPDIVCVSKGLTGGFLPLGLTVCSLKVYEAFYSDDKAKTFFHGHSYTGNPLSCAAACASMDITESEECKNNVERIVRKHGEFANYLHGREEVEKIRQRGTILAFDIKTNEGTSYFNSLRDTLYNFFLEKGVLLRPLGNTLYILPPYVITDQELDFVYSSIKSLLNSIESGSLKN